MFNETAPAAPKAALRRATKHAPDGRLVFTRPEQRKLLPQVARNEAAACDREGCGCARFKLGRYCKSHARTYAATGHPTAPSVRRGTWLPYVVTALAFVREQLREEHPGIMEGVRWTAAELFPQRVVVTRSDAKRPHRSYQAALGRARRNGVEPADLLARAIAAELADDRGDTARPLFKSDEHRAHQGARLFLYALPLGSSGYDRRKRGDGPLPEPPRIKWRAREYTARRVGGALGFLALNAATEIKRRMANVATPSEQIPGSVAGSGSPFASTSSTSTAP
jgi:hypothetical protein